MNLVTDSLQRTCTGTIVVQLSGSVWEPDTNGNGSGSGSGSGGDREPGEPGQVTNPNQVTSSEGPQPTTGTLQGGQYSTPFRQNPEDPEVVETSLYDNVHLGPAGIGLLIMGFLVLGCKHFNPSFDISLSEIMAKETKQSRCPVLAGIT